MMDHPWRSNPGGFRNARSSISRRAITLGAAVIAAVLIASFLGYESLSHTTAANSAAVKSSAYPLNFLVIGDWGREGGWNQRKVASQMGKVGEEKNIDFVISTGDNFYEYGLKGVDDPKFHNSFTAIYTAPSLQKTWYSVLGNHDYRGDVQAQISEALNQRDNRWRCQRELQLRFPVCERSNTGVCESFVDIFLIDTTPYVEDYWDGKARHEHDWSGIPHSREEQLRMQTEALKKNLQNSTATWKIVVGHHPIRSTGHHGDTAELLQLDPILKENNVDLYINGHDHHLEAIKSNDSKLQYITSGAGSKAWRNSRTADTENGSQFFYDGQGFVSVSGNTVSLHLDFHDAFGNVMHTIDIKNDQ